MVDIPGLPGEIRAPWQNEGPSEEEQLRDILRAKGRKWDGKGAPPSREAAIGWLLVNVSGMTLADARRVVGAKGSLTSIGRKVRTFKTEYTRDHEEWRKEWRRKHPELADEEGGEGQGGSITAEELAAAAEEGTLDETLEDLLGGEIGGPGATSTRGAPLWRYEGSEEQLATLEVQDRSQSAVHTFDEEGRMTWRGIDRGDRDSRRGVGRQDRTGARYFEQDTLEPLKWGAEQRADLQRVLSGIGLYGKKPKIRLGSWTAKDQAVYAELLASANEEGLTWQEMLAKWKREPPVDILDEINGGAGAERAPLVVQLTNPTDIQEATREVSRSLIGREDRGFIGGTAGAYNQIEAQTQTAAYNAGEEGGTVTDAPSVTAYASDQLRRSKPAEVDSYSTLGAFNEILRQLGLAG